MNALAAFLAFFETTFAESMTRAEIPGMPTASWDRMAAWLLWTNTDEGRAFVPPLSVPTTDTPQQPNEGIFG